MVCFLSGSVAQTVLLEDLVAIRTIKLSLHGKNIAPSFKTGPSKNNPGLPNLMFYKQTLFTRSNKKEEFFVPAGEISQDAAVQILVDFSSMNVPEAVLSINYSLKKIEPGFSAETIYIIGWKGAELDNRVGFINKTFPCKQVQYTPIHPGIFKLRLAIPL